MRSNGRFIKAFGKFAIPNITAYWVMFQVMCMLMIWMKPEFAAKLNFHVSLVLQGEWWRAITFLFMPASLSPIFAAFVLYFYWMMGSALEREWGAPRYNLFLLLGALFNIGVAFLPILAGLRDGIGTNTYILESVFLAFATLYPDFIMRLFFVLPVKIKWLALMTWLLLTAQFLLGTWTEKAMVASVGNFFIFFGKDFWLEIKRGKKHLVQHIRVAPDLHTTSLHRCVICGHTEKTAPQKEFRYCADCGNKCYCLEDLQTHAHIP